MSADIQTPTNLANLPISRLVGYPRSPLSGGGMIGLPGFLMIEANQRAWRVFTDQVSELPDKPAPDFVCTAPFFVD